MATVADGSYGVDIDWYVDSGAINHITNEHEKVTMMEKYRGKDHIHTVSGEGMQICHWSINFSYPSS